MPRVKLSVMAQDFRQFGSKGGMLKVACWHTLKQFNIRY